MIIEMTARPIAPFARSDTLEVSQEHEEVVAGKDDWRLATSFVKVRH